MKYTSPILILLIAIAFNANSQIIVNPISSNSNFVTILGTLESSAYNGTGLITSPSLTSRHLPTVPANSAVTDSLTGIINFHFNGTYSINGLSFWNQNNGGPFTDIGVDSVNFYASTDSINYTLITGAPTNFLEVFTDTSGPETFTFPDVLASHVRMVILSNHGNTSFMGFAEIAFSASRLVSLDELSALNSISIYPNPSKDFVMLEGIGNQKNYFLYNLSGQEVLRGNISKGETIDIRGLESGLYFIKTEDSKLFKIIKH